MIGYKPVFFIKWCWMILTPGICAVSGIISRAVVAQTAYHVKKNYKLKKNEKQNSEDTYGWLWSFILNQHGSSYIFITCANNKFVLCSCRAVSPGNVDFHILKLLTLNNTFAQQSTKIQYCNFNLFIKAVSLCHILNWNICKLNFVFATGNFLVFLD